ncbi:hypothetical protein ACFL07_02520 [Pseudomonadota bacterium]
MNKTLYVLACLLASNVWAYDDCKFEKRIDTTLDLATASQLNIDARAGDLKVTGDAHSSEAVIEATICASEEDWADESWLKLESGKTAMISVHDPRDGNSSWYDNESFSVDLTISVPAGLALSIRDSSGPLSVQGSGDLTIQDSSGDIDVRDIQGMVSIEDSSGDIDLRQVEGDLVIEGDSSGNISGTDIRGSVLVKQDSSGNIRFENVQDDFIVERDSSGNIVADTIGGDFRVLKDGSGSIQSRNVSGKIDIPEKS